MQGRLTARGCSKSWAMTQNSHRFSYRWRLADGFPAPGVTPNGRKVFGTFVCGGGSAMGYKLAGFDYLGGVEIDPKVAAIYADNLKPRHLYVEDIRDFNKREDLPAELYNLDILDGSPPCTLFSLNRGRKREDSWGKTKKFAEGQKEQTLEDLPFVWCDTVAKLRPKVCLMENVEGLVKGGAKAYCSNIIWKLGRAGYDAQLFVLDAQFMGVPQRRRRVFIIGRRRDLGLPRVELNFQEPVIPFSEIEDKEYIGHDYDLGPVCKTYWEHLKPGDTSLGDGARALRKTSMFSVGLADLSVPLPTICTNRPALKHKPRYMTDKEVIRGGGIPGGLQLQENTGGLPHRDVGPANDDRQHSLRN